MERRIIRPEEVGLTKVAGISFEDHNLEYRIFDEPQYMSPYFRDSLQNHIYNVSRSIYR